MNIARLAPPVGPVAGRKGACTPRTCGVLSRGFGRANAQTPANSAEGSFLTKELQERLEERHRIIQRVLEQVRANFSPQHAPESMVVHRQPEVEQWERQLDSIDMALIQIEQTAAIEKGTAVREAQRHDAENATFWFRRFMLSLQIGNGAGFLATAAVVGQVDADAISLAAVLAWAPATYFGLGTGAAGLLPLVMAAHAWAKEHPRGRCLANIAGWLLTTFAVGFFACGMTSVVCELRQLGQPAVRQAEPPAPAPTLAPAPPAADQSGSPAGAEPPKASAW